MKPKQAKPIKSSHCNKREAPNSPSESSPRGKDQFDQIDDFFDDVSIKKEYIYSGKTKRPAPPLKGVGPKCHKGDTWNGFDEALKAKNQTHKSRVPYMGKVGSNYPQFPLRIDKSSLGSLPRKSLKDAFKKKLLNAKMTNALEAFKTKLQEQLIGVIFKSRWFYTELWPYLAQHKDLLVIKNKIPLKFVLKVSRQLLYTPNTFLSKFV